MDLYEDAFLYDLVHGLYADPEVFQFYNESVGRYGSPVLELACGTGNVLIPLAEAGADIRGIDISASMLRTCRQKAADRGVTVQVAKADMRDFDLGQRFRLIYIAGNSLQHLNSITDISACFASVKRHLEPDGKFVVEVSNPYVPLLVREMGKRYVVGEFGEYVLTEDVMYDSALQLSDINWHFWHRPSDREKTLSFKLRQFFPQELDSLFLLHGFRIDHKFGDLDRSGFASGSAAQIVVASLA